MRLPLPFERLTAALSRLPSVGKRSAERMALALIRDPEGAEALARALESAGKDMRTCSRCGSLTLREEDPCRFCADARRDGDLLCVVSNPGDVWRIERSGAFRGRYHVLPARLSPMRGEGPRELGMGALLDRVRAEGFKEAVLALSADVESEATAAFLAEKLSAAGLRVTRPACGLPVGGGLSYADDLTLSRALDGRR